MWHGRTGRAGILAKTNNSLQQGRNFMMTAFATLVLLALAQGPGAAGSDARVKEIAPFVSPDVFAVIHVDVAKLDVPKLSARVFGDAPPGFLSDGKAFMLRWSEGLKAAGAKDLYVLFSIIDMPGQPLVIVPLAGGAQAEGIARTIHGEATPIHNAIVAGTAEAVARVGKATEPVTVRPNSRRHSGRSVRSRWRFNCSFFRRQRAVGSWRRWCRCCRRSLGAGR